MLTVYVGGCDVISGLPDTAPTHAWKWDIAIAPPHLWTVEQKEPSRWCCLSWKHKDTL